jgi:hypothetical protein
MGLFAVISGRTKVVLVLRDAHFIAVSASRTILALLFFGALFKRVVSPLRAGLWQYDSFRTVVAFGAWDAFPFGHVGHAVVAFSALGAVRF